MGSSIFEPVFSLRWKSACSLSLVLFAEVALADLSFNFYVSGFGPFSIFRPQDAVVADDALTNFEIGDKYTVSLEIGEATSECAGNFCSYSVARHAVTGPAFSYELLSPTQGIGINRLGDSSVILSHGALTTDFTILGRDSTTVSLQTGGSNPDSGSPISFFEFQEHAQTVFQSRFFLPQDILSSLDLSNRDEVLALPLGSEFVDPDLSFARINYEVLNHLAGDPFGSFNLSSGRVTVNLTPGGREFFWRGGSGDFADADNWSPFDEVPGSTAPREVARIVENGTYVVSGGTPDPLLLIEAGNDIGTITLAPQFDAYVTEHFVVSGEVKLEFGDVEVSKRAAIAADAALTVGQNGVVAFVGTGGTSFAQEMSVDGELIIRDNGRVSAPSLALGRIGTSAAGLRVEGAAALLSVDDSLGLSTGAGSESNLLVTNGAAIGIGFSLEMALGEDSRATGLLTGSGSIMRGETPLDGIPIVTIGTVGDASMSVSDHAQLVVTERLVLGDITGSLGSLTVQSDARVSGAASAAAIPGTSKPNVEIGSGGRGIVDVRDGGHFFTGDAGGQRLRLGVDESGDGLLTISGVVRDAGGEPVPTTFADTVVGSEGIGNLRLNDGATWLTESLLIGDVKTARGLVDIDGVGTSIGLQGERLVVVGGNGDGTLSLGTGSGLFRATSPADGQLPLEMHVGLSGDNSIRARGRVLVDGGFVLGGDESRLFVGARADGAQGIVTGTNNSTLQFDGIEVGYRSAAPTLVETNDEIFEAVIGDSPDSNPAPQGASVAPAFSFPADANPETTGMLGLAGGSELDVGGGSGALIVGSRGYLAATGGATINTGLLQIGIEDSAADLVRNSGNGAVAKFSGDDTRVDAISVVVGPPDELAPTEISTGNVITITDSAVVATDLAHIDGRTSMTIEEFGAFAADSITIGGAREFPLLRSEGVEVDEALTAVTLKTGGTLAASTRILVGDDTRAGAFEPLATFAVLSIDETSTLTTEHLVVANGGALGGSAAGVAATTTEVFAGGLIGPGFSPGTLTFNGDVIFHPGARLQLEIGGSEPGAFDQFIVNGELSGEAVLELRFIDGFIPEVGEAFELIGQSAGPGLSLDSLVLDGLGEGAVVDFAVGAAGSASFTVLDVGAIAAVPLPATGWLLLASLGVLTRIRQRQGTSR